MLHRFILFLSVATIAGSIGMGTSASAAAPDASGCFRDLLKGRGTEIVCEFPVRPNAQEMAEMQKQSRGLLKAANCKVSIRIERAQITAAIQNPDHQFVAPPQSVSCDVTTAGRNGDMQIPITGTFAPKVTIKDGRAVDGTPGLDNIQGVPRPISWPIQYWVNSGSYVKGTMLQVVNAWLDHMRNDVQRRADAR